MHLNKVPLDKRSQDSLNALFNSAAFQLFLETLQAEFEHQLWEAKVASVDQLFDPTLQDDARGQIHSAAKLRCALEVIEAHTKSQELFTLQIET